MMSASARLLDLFMQAQQREDADDASGATKLYEKLIQYAEANVSPDISSVADEALTSALSPPADLIVSTALTSLGGMHLDTCTLEEARRCFRRSLSWWPGNGMALLNLGDIEREHGCLAMAIKHYEAAAALPPLHVSPEEADGDEVDDDEGEEDDDDDASEGDGVDGDEDEEDEDEPGWCASWVGQPRVESVSLASYMCALLHSQALAFDAALPYLHRFARLRLRLAPSVWRLAANRPTATLRELGAAERDDAQAVRRFEGCVPAPLLERLRHGFALGSPFWQETNYAARGYFSFWYDVACEPSNTVEALARHLLPLTGAADEIVGCEWWVHTRAEGRSIGHQMHWDTEEVSLQRGEILHPLVSSVTYLSGASGGDPTVVLDQRTDDDEVGRAFVSHPLVGATLFFPGDRLHCVLPTKATTKKRARGAQPHNSMAADADPARGDLPLLAASACPQRVTLMIGFWTRPVNTLCERPLYGACGPTPRATRRCTWPARVALPEDGERAALENASARAHATTVGRAVPCVEGNTWERLETKPTKPTKPTKRTARQCKESASAWVGLPVPEARNHRFFVRAVSEFREQICALPPVDG